MRIPFLALFLCSAGLAAEGSKSAEDHRKIVMRSGDLKVVDLHFKASPDFKLSDPKTVGAQLRPVKDRTELLLGALKNGRARLEIRDDSQSLRLRLEIEVISGEPHRDQYFGKSGYTNDATEASVRPVLMTLAEGQRALLPVGSHGFSNLIQTSNPDVLSARMDRHPDRSISLVFRAIKPGFTTILIRDVDLDLAASIRVHVLTNEQVAKKVREKSSNEDRLIMITPILLRFSEVVYLGLASAVDRRTLHINRLIPDHANFRPFFEILSEKDGRLHRHPTYISAAEYLSAQRDIRDAVRFLREKTELLAPECKDGRIEFHADTTGFSGLFCPGFVKPTAEAAAAKQIMDVFESFQE